MEEPGREMNWADLQFWTITLIIVAVALWEYYHE